MAKVGEFDKGLRAKTRPSNLDVRGQQRELFPFDAFEYESPDQSSSPFVRLKQPWVFGVDTSGIIGNSIDGTRRLLLKAGEIVFQRWDPDNLVWEDVSKLGSTQGGLYSDYTWMKGYLHPNTNLDAVDLGFKGPTGSRVFDFDNVYTDKDGADPWGTKTNLAFDDTRKVYGSHALKASGGVGELKAATFSGLQFGKDLALAHWFYRAQHVDFGATEQPEITTITPVADDAGSLDGTSFSLERIRPDRSLESVGVELIQKVCEAEVAGLPTFAKAYGTRFSHDGTMFAWCGPTGHKVYDTSDWSVLYTSGDGCWGAAFTPDDSQVAFHTNAAGSLKVVNTGDWSTVSGTPSLAHNGEGPHYSPDGSLLASPLQGDSPSIIVHNTSDWSVAYQEPNGNYSRAFELAFSPDGTMLAVLCDTSAPYFVVYDTSDWSKISGTPSLPTYGFGLDWSPDGTLLHLGINSNAGRVYQVSDWSLVHSTANFALGSAFSPDGKYLVCTSDTSPYLYYYSVADWTALTVAFSTPSERTDTCRINPAGDLLIYTLQTTDGGAGLTFKEPSITGYDTILPVRYTIDGSLGTLANELATAVSHPSWTAMARAVISASLTWQETTELFSDYNAFDDGWAPTELDPSNDYALSSTVDVVNGGTTYTIHKVRFVHVNSGDCISMSKQIDYRIAFLDGTDTEVLTWEGSASVTCVGGSWEAGPWDTTSLTFTGLGTVTSTDLEANQIQITNTHDGNVTDGVDVDSGFTIATEQQGSRIDQDPKDFVTLHDGGDAWTKEGDNGGRYVDVKSVAGLTEIRVACVADVGSGMQLSLREWDSSTDGWSSLGGELTIADGSRTCICKMSSSRVALFDGLTGELKCYEFTSSWAQVGNTLTLDDLVGGTYYRLARLTATRVALGTDADGTLRTLDFDGTDWSQTGDAYVVPTGIAVNGFDIAGLNATTIVLAQGETSEMVNYKFDGTTWSQEGTAIAPETTVNNPSIAVMSETEIVYGSLATKRAKGFSWDGDQWVFTFQGAENTSADAGYIFAVMSETRVMGVMFDTTLGPLFETWTRTSTVEVKHLYPTGLGLYLNGKQMLTLDTEVDAWNFLWLYHVADADLGMQVNAVTGSVVPYLAGTTNIDVTFTLSPSVYQTVIDDLLVSTEDTLDSSFINSYRNGEVPFTEDIDYINDVLIMAAPSGSVHIRSPLVLHGLVTRKGAYQPGEIIEYLSGPCDGRTLSGISGDYVLENVTATMIATDSYQVITGSTVNYVPPAGARTVYYRFAYQWDAASNSGISHHRLMVDGTEVQPAYKSQAGGYQTHHHDNWTVVMEYTFDLTHGTDDPATGRFAGWTSLKEIRVEWRRYNSTYQSRIHSNAWRDGGGSSAPYDVHTPNLMIMAIG